MTPTIYQELKALARVILRKAIKCYGRAHVRSIVETYESTIPNFDQAIKEAFDELARESR